MEKNAIYYQLGLTKSSTSKISEMDVSVPSQGMEGSSDTVAVEADAHANYEQNRPRRPAQKGHDEEGVPQNEGIVKPADQVEANKPGVVCTHHKWLSAQLACRLVTKAVAGSGGGLCLRQTLCDLTAATVATDAGMNLCKKQCVMLNHLGQAHAQTCWQLPALSDPPAEACPRDQRCLQNLLPCLTMPFLRLQRPSSTLHEIGDAGLRRVSGNMEGRGLVHSR